MRRSDTQIATLSFDVIYIKYSAYVIIYAYLGLLYIY